jgi:2-dehydropantoate 2-reductase
MGLCRIVCLLREPGNVRHVALRPTVALGEWDRPSLSQSAEILAASLENAGIVVERPSDIRVALWQKLIFISALSGMGAVSRSPVGDVRECPATRELLVGLMEEVTAVARARGVLLPEDVVPRTLVFIDSMAHQSTTSMQRDIEEAKPSELEAIVGVVVRSGQELGVPTPVARFVYASLFPQEKRVQTTRLT